MSERRSGVTHLPVRLGTVFHVGSSGNEKRVVSFENVGKDSIFGHEREDCGFQLRTAEK